MKQTGVDYVMIGRGAIGNPYIFSELLNKPFKLDLLNDIKFHYNKICEVFSQEVAVNNMKKHLAMYLKGEKNYKEIITEIYKEKDFNKTMQLINKYLA